MLKLRIWIAMRPVLWTILHPRRSVARYEQALDCLIEAVKR